MRASRRAILVVLAVAALAIVVIGAELMARTIVASQVRQIAIAELDLPETQEIEVGLGGVVLVQLVTGSLDDLEVSSEDVTLDGISGDVSVRAHGVPVRGDDLSATGGSATLRMDGADVAALLDASMPAWSQGAALEVSLPGPEATITTQIQVLGQSLPLSFDAVPGLEAGDVVATPQAIRIGELSLTVDALERAPIDLSALAAPLTICRADALPSGISIDEVAVSDERLVLSASAADGALSDPEALAGMSCR